MKHEKLANALSEVQDKHINEAAAPKKRHTWRWISAVAAVLAVVITLTAVLSPAATVKALVAAPTYPEMTAYPKDPNNYIGYELWYLGQKNQYDQPQGFGDSLQDFFSESIPVFLDSSTENAVYSPVNVYMALSMLAETTDGDTRQQILDVLNAQSMDDLRQQAGYMWNAHYSDDGLTTLLLANSLWLDSTLSYDQDTAATLARDYYASVYHGDLGSEELNKNLRDWLNQNTGGLLKEQAADLALDDRTLLALASTIYYKVQWADEFMEQRNEEGIFHTPDGDKTVTYMRRTMGYGPYYYGEDYAAVPLYLEDGNRMWLILPDAGHTPQDILESGQVLQDLFAPGEPKNFSTTVVHLKLPKFDVASETDLSQGLQALGLTHVFDPEKADFSSISSEDLFVSQAEHAARVKIDEKGLEAAAYTVLEAPGAGMPPEEEVDFYLDRPFLFVIESRSGMPLFTGVVNKP